MVSFMPTPPYPGIALDRRASGIEDEKFRSIILPMVQYWLGTCSLILREEHVLRVLEERVLRAIFGPKGG
jgi:hypothetical protein